MPKIKHLAQNTMHEKSMEKAKKYLAEENYVDAKDEVEKILDENPNDDRALNLLAIIMLKLDQYGKAVKIYEDLVTRYQQTEPLRINLGVAYLKNNQPDNSAKEFSVVLQKDPDNKTVLKLYGKALLKLNRIDEAIKAFKKAGMHDYVKKIKKHGPDEPVVSELTTDDVMQEAIGKDKGMEIQEKPSEEEAGPGTAAGDTDEQAEEESSGQQNEEPEAGEDEENEEDEQIIETERGPSAIDEQELLNDEETGKTAEEEAERESEESEEEEKEEEKDKQSTEEEKPEEEQRGSKETQARAADAVHPPLSAAEQVQEKDPGKPSPHTTHGLSAILEETVVSRFESRVNFIKDSMLLFNMDGNVVYARNKGIVSLTEGLTIEQAYKRYRGKDTKSLFAELKDDPIVLVYGRGSFILRSDFKSVKPFNLKNESMFLDDDRLVAFLGDLEWENGRVEVQSDKSINVTQIRGTADIFLGLSNNLISIRVSTETPLSVKLSSLIGWNGKLIPKPSDLKQYTTDHFLSFHGDGVVFIDA